MAYKIGEECLGCGACASECPVNAISENAYSNELVAQELLDSLNEKQAKAFREFYKLPDDKELNIDNISLERNWLLTGGSTDRERTAVYILRDFREGKIGKFILDTITRCE